MDFYPLVPFDDNRAQNCVWAALQEAFRGNAHCGVCYYRYPVFVAGGRYREPDVLLLHRQLGLWVIECKGCGIDNITQICGQEWRMQGWLRPTEHPWLQAQAQRYAVEANFLRTPEAQGLLSFHFQVALPLITREAWAARGFDKLQPDAVLLQEDLSPDAVAAALRRLAASHPQRPLTDEQWSRATAVLSGPLPSPVPRSVPAGTPVGGPVRVIREIEERFKSLDEEQQKAAFQVPDGPQRLRGLAGTGKTVLLARRLAKILASRPDWRAAFVFFTKSLYGHVLDLVTDSYRDLTGAAPGRDKVEVLHAWGGRTQPGFYYNLSQAFGHVPMTAEQAGQAAGTEDPGLKFKHVCDLFNAAVPPGPGIYDALLVDEGQDLPESFYRVALKLLKEPKRLYWAYDEAQVIGSLEAPKPAVIFGKKEDGSPAVDLSGFYAGGIEKSLVFRRCYRTPERLLMAAHAMGMGLLRRTSVQQGITRRESWRQLGYEVDGNFTTAGSPVRLRRQDDVRVHPFDAAPELAAAAGPPLVVHALPSELDEERWVARQIAADIRVRSFQPADLLVTSLGPYEKKHLDRLETCLDCC